MQYDKLSNAFLFVSHPLNGKQKNPFSLRSLRLGGKILFFSAIRYKYSIIRKVMKIK